ncbi:YHYH domain-containing protein [Paenibacillus glacialis]|uniref:YHYH domain-containing protein n=1 Tax=Paenibacillus glacialis TaxID=494026 RepID=UPI000ADE3C0A|nr:YHYH domain-containing protein [Paenibacillus glacialis]
MKKIIVLFIALIVLLGTSSSAFAHSGRTDKNGGHNCSAKSKQKGLCTGYHYHKKKK